MKNVTRTQVKRFVQDPLSYAVLMDDEEIEEVIARLMCILYKRKGKQGGD